MVDRDFGNWLAGFIDGEGCFYITRDRVKGAWRARFSMSLRADDRAILIECKERTGIGSLHEYQGQSGQRVARWMVQSKSDCIELSNLMTTYPMRAKKRHDFEVWNRALLEIPDLQTGRYADNKAYNARMLALKEELAEVRRKGL